MSHVPRIGVVGVGSLGRHHARILASLPGARASGVHDVRPGRAAEVASELGLEARPTLDALLAESDGLVVAVPTSEHEAVACEALARGVHVLVEKPLAPTLDAADRILAAARASRALLQVGHVERFNPIVRAARDHLESPLFIESHRMAPFTPRSIDVAVVLDLMIHDVDLVMRLVDRPIVDIAAVGLPVLSGNVDIANARLTFEGGAVANLTASRVSAERMRKLRVFQRSGYLSLDLAARTGSFLRLRGALPSLAAPGADGDGARASEAAPAAPLGLQLSDIVERIELTGDDGSEPLALELASFRDAIRDGAGPAVPGTEGREALAVTLAIQERIENHVADSRAP